MFNDALFNEITFNGRKIISITLAITEISNVSLFKTKYLYRTLSVIENSIISLKKGFSKTLNVIENSIPNLQSIKINWTILELRITETVIPSLNRTITGFRNLSVIENSVVVLRKGFSKLLSVVEVSNVVLEKVRPIVLSVVSNTIVSLTMMKTFFIKLEVKVISFIKLLIPIHYWDKFTKQGDSYNDKYLNKSDIYRDKYD